MAKRYLRTIPPLNENSDYWNTNFDNTTDDELLQVAYHPNYNTINHYVRDKAAKVYSDRNPGLEGHRTVMRYRRSLEELATPPTIEQMRDNYSASGLTPHNEDAITSIVQGLKSSVPKNNKGLSNESNTINDYKNKTQGTITAVTAGIPVAIRKQEQDRIDKVNESKRYIDKLLGAIGLASGVYGLGRYSLRGLSYLSNNLSNTFRRNLSNAIATMDKGQVYNSAVGSAINVYDLLHDVHPGEYVVDGTGLALDVNGVLGGTNYLRRFGRIGRTLDTAMDYIGGAGSATDAIQGFYKLIR